MKVRLLSYAEESEQPNIVVKSRITSVFSVYSDKSCIIEKTTSVNDLLSKLGASLKDNELSVIFAGLSVYSSAKNTLIKALHLKSEISIDILDKLPEDMSAVDKELHSTFPCNSVVFSGADGSYSPFCCRSGKQYILFCPLSEKCLFLIENNISSYLAKICSRPSSDCEQYVKLFRDAADLLYSGSLTCAVANTSTCEVIRSIIGLGGKSAKTFKFSEEKVAPCRCEPQDHIAREAVKAANECNAVFGIAISNIFILKKHDTKQRIVYIAVYDNNNVNVSRIYSDSDDVNVFLKKACCQLFGMLAYSVTELLPVGRNDDFDLF